MSKLISAFTNDALGTMDAVAIAEAIAKKEISVSEATEAAITRAEKVNGELNAIVLKTYDDARNHHLLTKEGAFYGVPSFIKDNDNIIGYPTQMGTGAFNAKKAKQNSGFVNQFLSTGVNYLGKSTMPEFGLICSTENERWGITRNPWDTDYTTGGSSSGSAALVASGVVPIATANNGAGSIRIPAACCGLVGLKPSRGRLVAMDGSNLMPLQIVYQGVLTRTVRDTATFYSAAEKFYSNKNLPAMGHITHLNKKRLSFAFFDNPAAGKLGHYDADTHRTLLDTAKLLQTLGHTVVQIPMPINVESTVDHFLNYYGFLAYLMSHWGYFMFKSKVDKAQLEAFTMGLSKRFKKNALQTPISINWLKKTGRVVEKLFDQYDVLMTPVVAHKTPKIGHFSAQLSYEDISSRVMEYASYAAMQNVTGAPAISLPLGISDNNMPLGIQFTAPFGLDKRLIELAFELEEAQPWRLVSQK